MERYGVASTLHALAVRAVNRITYFRILKTLKVDRLEPRPQAEDGYRYGFLTPEELLAYARDPKHEMTESFVRAALAKGDECFAVRDGERLACYGWASHLPTKMSEDLLVCFDDRYVYRYKSYTAEAYRGRHIHSEAIQRALRVYLARGHQGFLCYVESNNLGSLRSCRRAGYQDFGEVWVAKVLGRHLAHATHGCRPYGFRVQAKRNASAVAAAAAAMGEGDAP